MNTNNQQSFLAESQKWMALALLLLTGWVLYLLSPVLSPFIMGAVLAYLGDPLVDRLENKKIPRTLGVVIVFVFFSSLAIIALLMFIPLVQKQLIIVYQSIPGFLTWVNTTAIPWLTAQTGLSLDNLDPNFLTSAIENHLKSAGSLAADILSGVGSSSIALAVWLTNLVLIPVVAFYLMRDWDKLLSNFRDMLPRKNVSTTSRLALEMDEVLGAFLRGQLLVMLALGIIYSLGLWMIGLNVALIVGMVAGLASIVPYLGFIVGITAAVIAAILQYSDFSVLLYVVLVFGVGQILESVLLTPLLVGDKIGLHPVAVIFAIMAGGQLFGFIGILVALPVAAVIMVLLRDLSRQYKSSSAYGSGSKKMDSDINSAEGISAVEIELSDIEEEEPIDFDVPSDIEHDLSAEYDESLSELKKQPE